MLKRLLQGLAATALLATFQTAAAEQILVFDNSVHKSAQLTAEARYPGQVTLATSANFDTLVPSQPWDLVLVNCPSTKPATWLPLAFYILGGGRTVISYWDFDDASWPGTQELLFASEVALGGTIVLNGDTLTDADTSNAFFEIPMPNSDWDSHWGDDGDSFQLLGAAKGLAYIGQVADPVMVLGNNGRSLLLPVMDEVGSSWTTAGHDRTFWNNVIDVVWNNGSCLHYHGALGLNPGGFHCTFNPQAGYPWRARIDPVPTQGVSTAATVVILGFGGITNSKTIRGYEQLILGPYVMHSGFEFHKIPMDPSLLGISLQAQGMRIEVGPNGEQYFVLLNRLELVVG